MLRHFNDSNSMPSASLSDLRSCLLALLLGLAAATLCKALHTPLPWMVGPLFASAAARMAGVNLFCPAQIRQSGQWAIGTALGLYFTPLVLIVLASYVLWIVIGLVFAMLLGLASAWLLTRLSGVDRVTAFFAMAIGGASEMAAQGEHHGAAVDRIAAAHSLRIMMVVAIVPFAFKLLDVHGADPFVPSAQEVRYDGLALLVALTSAGALLLGRLNWPNSWVIGPLTVAILLTGCGVNLSALPEWMTHIGQLFIGISLGTRFTPEFLRTAPRYMASVACCALLAIVAAGGFGLLLAWASGIHPATAILATSPGGIAEMSLTARTLQLGVPIVTAFHVIRMSVIVLTIGPLFRSLRYFQEQADA